MPGPFFTLALTLLFAASALADYKDDIGFTALKNELGAATPTGAGIPVTQTEALEGTNYLPDTSSGEFTGKSFLIESGTSGVSGHATIVASYYYGLFTSTAPGVSSIHNFSAGDWVSTGFLNTGTFSAPKVETQAIENHSWISSATGAYDQEILRRFDYAIQRDDFLAVVGLNNGSGTPIPTLLGSSYDAISVGLTDGNHSSSTTTIDGTGRVKPEIVAPYSVTSFATPMVGAAAALLREKATATAALVDAKRAPVLKALLLSGATKSQFPGWNRTTARPLDAHYGAGQLNVQNSYHILVAGKQSASSSAVVGIQGWDYNTTQPGTRRYFFDVPAGKRAARMSALVTWNRTIKSASTFVFTNPSSTVADLTLKLYSATGFNLNTTLDSSQSPVDNLEHIYRLNMPAGRYALEVSSPTSDVSYGFAWDAKVVALSNVNITVTDNSASEFGSDTGSFLIARSGGDTTEPVTVNFTIGGSAANGVDYVAIPASATIPANEVAVSVIVQPIKDTLAEGDETITLTLLADTGYALGSSLSGLVTIHDDPFDAWRKAHFTASELADSSISGELADAEGDGISNLLEFAFAFDPKVSSVAQLPQPQIVNDHLTLIFKHPKAAVNLIYTPEISTDLLNFTSDPARIQQSTITDPSDSAMDVTTATSTASASMTPREFLRVRVDRN